MPTPPVEFVDADGNRWLPEFTDEAVAQVRASFGFDLDELAARADDSIARELLGDVFVTATVLLIACYLQRPGWGFDRATGPDGVAFVTAVVADHETHTRAVGALFWALGRRYPNSEPVRAMARVLPGWRRKWRAEPLNREGGA